MERGGVGSRGGEVECERGGAGHAWQHGAGAARSQLQYAGASMHSRLCTRACWAHVHAGRRGRRAEFAVGCAQVPGGRVVADEVEDGMASLLSVA
jgi:hypothetical protein